jgi:hypothetical protein
MWFFSNITRKHKVQMQCKHMQSYNADLTSLAKSLVSDYHIAKAWTKYPVVQESQHSQQAVACKNGSELRNSSRAACN